jgi:xanthine dehydrogenase/oxidase
MSTRAHARLVSVDPAHALAHPGVQAFFSAANVPGSNHTGPVVHDEEVFASSEVTCIGHVIGIVVATTRSAAQEAAKMVKIECVTVTDDGLYQLLSTHCCLA